ncbi:hypothetical protein BC830DRAFT_287836 [Chytriomyces sp. MP71]|nr:hypothetical protein BC830DRAFT_287836 [Chytriomyces sp. MP71]
MHAHHTLHPFRLRIRIRTLVQHTHTASALRTTAEHKRIALLHEAHAPDRGHLAPDRGKRRDAIQFDGEEPTGRVVEHKPVGPGFHHHSLFFMLNTEEVMPEQGWRGVVDGRSSVRHQAHLHPHTRKSQVSETKDSFAVIGHLEELRGKHFARNVGRTLHPFPAFLFLATTEQSRGSMHAFEIECGSWKIGAGGQVKKERPNHMVVRFLYD